MQSRLIAELRLQNFREINSLTKVGTPERAWYDCVMDVATIIGRGISRYKEQHLKDLEELLEMRNNKLQEIRHSRKSGDNLSAGWWLMKPAALWLCGFLLAQFVGLVLPLSNLTPTGDEPGILIKVVINVASSIVFGLIFMWIGRSVSYYVLSFKRARVEHDYQAIKHQIIMTYEDNKLRQFNQYRKVLCGAYLLYFGEEPPETVSYEMVMAGDAAARNRLEQQVKMSNLNDFRTIMRLARRFGIRVNKKIPLPSSG
jgi:hypothetical protein